MFVNSEKTSTSGGLVPVANYRAAGVICELWPIFISVKAISELNKSIASLTNAVPCHSLVLQKDCECQDWCSQLLEM